MKRAIKLRDPRYTIAYEYDTDAISTVTTPMAFAIRASDRSTGIAVLTVNIENSAATAWPKHQSVENRMHVLLPLIRKLFDYPDDYQYAGCQIPKKFNPFPKSIFASIT